MANVTLDELKKKIEEIENSLDTKADEIYKNIKDSLRSKSQKIVEEIINKEVIDKIKERFEKEIEKEMGSSIYEGLEKGFEQKVKDEKDKLYKLKELVKSKQDEVNRALQENK